MRGPTRQPLMRRVSQICRMSFVKVGMKRSMTAVGRKMQNGSRMRSSVERRFSTRVVSASTMTTFIMVRPRRKGMKSDCSVIPPIEANQFWTAKPQRTAKPIIAAVSAYRTARSIGRLRKAA